MPSFYFPPYPMRRLPPSLAVRVSAGTAALFAGLLFISGTLQTGAIAPPPAVCSPADSTLGAYWKFDTDNGAGITPDSTTYDNAGTFMSGAARSTTQTAPTTFINPASLSLNATGAYVQVGDTTGLPQAAAPRSITLWMKQATGASLAQSTLVSLGNGAAPTLLRDSHQLAHAFSQAGRLPGVARRSPFGLGARVT